MDTKTGRCNWRTRRVEYLKKGYRCLGKSRKTGVSKSVEGMGHGLLVIVPVARGQEIVKRIPY